MKKMIFISFVLASAASVYADKISDADMKQAEQEFKAVGEPKHFLDLIGGKTKALVKAQKAVVRYYILKKLNQDGYTKSKVLKDIENAKTQYYQGTVSTPEMMNQDMGTVFIFMDESPIIKEFVHNLLQ